MAGAGGSAGAALGGRIQGRSAFAGDPAGGSAFGCGRGGGGAGRARAGGGGGVRCGRRVGRVVACGGRGAGPTRGRGAAARGRGTSGPSISARRGTNQRGSEPRPTSGSRGQEVQSLTVASIPAARRGTAIKAKEPADPRV